MKKRTFHTFTLTSLWVLVVLATVTSVTPLIPLSWVIHHGSVDYSDVCVGETQQVVTSNRSVPFALSATSTGEVHKIADGIRLETTIRRKADFVYQKESNSIHYTIDWDSPFRVAGEYEALQFVDIHFGWFNISGEAPRGKFSVIDC